MAGERAAMARRELRQAPLDAHEQAGDVVTGGADDLGDRGGWGRVRHQARVPAWIAMIPPAVRIQRMSRSPARSIDAARPSGAGKRRTELGR